MPALGPVLKPVPEPMPVPRPAPRAVPEPTPRPVPRPALGAEQVAGTQGQTVIVARGGPTRVGSQRTEGPVRPKLA